MSLKTLLMLYMYLFNVMACFGTAFHKTNAHLFSKLLALIQTDLPLFCQITLVADQDALNLGIGLFLSLFQPGLDVLEGTQTGHVVHDQRADRTSVV